MPNHHERLDDKSGLNIPFGRASLIELGQPKLLIQADQIVESYQINVRLVQIFVIKWDQIYLRNWISAIYAISVSDSDVVY